MPLAYCSAGEGHSALPHFPYLLHHACPTRSSIKPLIALFLFLRKSKHTVTKKISQFSKATNFSQSSHLERWSSKSRIVTITWRWCGFNKNVSWHSWIWKRIYEQAIMPRLQSALGFPKSIFFQLFLHLHKEMRTQSQLEHFKLLHRDLSVTCQNTHMSLQNELI